MEKKWQIRHELGLGLGNTTACANTINVCMWNSAMCKVRI
jgi:hypothetical protein